MLAAFNKLTVSLCEVFITDFLFFSLNGSFFLIPKRPINSAFVYGGVIIYIWCELLPGAPASPDICPESSL
jgi:hypothetical protein